MKEPIIGLNKGVINVLYSKLKANNDLSVQRSNPNLYTTHNRLGVVKDDIEEDGHGDIYLELWSDEDQLWYQTEQTFTGYSHKQALPEGTHVICICVTGKWFCFKPGGGGSGGTIEFLINSVSVAPTDSPYNGLSVATVTIVTAPCDRPTLIATTVDVVDHSGCVFDLEEADLIGLWGWATERVAYSLKVGEESDTVTPCHWAADDRCCSATGE